MSNNSIASKLSSYRKNITEQPNITTQGKIIRIVGLTVEAVGCNTPIGSRCLITPENEQPIEAEVVGFNNNTYYLIPLGEITGIRPGTAVMPIKHSSMLSVGKELLGRVVDYRGHPIDSQPFPTLPDRKPLHGAPVNPMDRKSITDKIDVGVKSINALLTLGKGQRVGLFSGSGVGKSILLGMLSRNTDVDVTVVALIGERSREVKHFIENNLTEKSKEKSVVVAAPADQSPLMRLNASYVAMTVAEYFRDQGKSVLLVFDSLTRFAQAQREIGLAVGEPPTTKGYPPSVFALLSKFVERAGNAGNLNGSITAVFTVLTEGDDLQDPVADAARAILDGHIVLSRKIADSGHYPAIDIEASISRIMNDISDAEHIAQAQLFRKYLALYRENEDLIKIGAYKQGTNTDVDKSLHFYPKLMEYLIQKPNESFTHEESLKGLNDLEMEK